MILRGIEWQNPMGRMVGVLFVAQVVIFLQCMEAGAQSPGTSEAGYPSLYRNRSASLPARPPKKQENGVAARWLWNSGAGDRTKTLNRGLGGIETGSAARQAVSLVVAQGGEAKPGAPLEEEVFPEDFPEDSPADEEAHIPDPLEPVNRVMYHFNDRLYFWVLKPVALGYRAIAPEPVRIGVRNFFFNLAFPIRFVNSMIQLKFQQAGEEARSFAMNTVCGLGGFLDVAGKDQGVKGSEEDFGQTLGYYGLGPGFYVMWPILGPSSLRDTVGLLGDRFLYPVSYVTDSSTASVAIGAFEHVNQTSLRIGEYEDLKKASFDPYVAIRDAYHQHRKAKIKE
ncbi:MAG: VacJ family lipoprotein [Deltaproteobacteria bacterium]|nr:VacJ family lipoprotein [Deltaproteobacteria bacterium]